MISIWQLAAPMVSFPQSSPFVGSKAVNPRPRRPCKGRLSRGALEATFGLAWIRPSVGERKDVPAVEERDVTDGTDAERENRYSDDQRDVVRFDSHDEIVD